MTSEMSMKKEISKHLKYLHQCSQRLKDILVMFCTARRSSRRRIGGGIVGGGTDNVWIVLGVIGGVLFIGGTCYCCYKANEKEEEEEAEQTPARY